MKYLNTTKALFEVFEHRIGICIPYGSPQRLQWQPVAASSCLKLAALVLVGHIWLFGRVELGRCKTLKNSSHTSQNVWAVGLSLSIMREKWLLYNGAALCLVMITVISNCVLFVLLFTSYRYQYRGYIPAERLWEMIPTTFSIDTSRII